jgi:hypothetical protein
MKFAVAVMQSSKDTQGGDHQTDLERKTASPEARPRSTQYVSLLLGEMSLDGNGGSSIEGHVHGSDEQTPDCLQGG